MLVFRNFIVILAISCCFSFADARFPRGAPIVSTFNGGGMLVGLGPPAYYSGGCPFLNWVLCNGGSNGMAVNLAAGGTQKLSTTYANGQIDANGELIAGAALSTISNLQIGIFTPPPSAPYVPPLNGASAWWNGLQMKVTWTGTSSPVIAGFSALGTGSVPLSCSTNSCTFTIGGGPNLSDQPSNITIQFPITNVNDPPKNRAVFKVAYQSQVTAAATCTVNVNCNRFAPDYVAAISSYGRARSMDWQATNGNGAVDDTQLAGFDYQLCVACNNGGGGYGQISISGTVMTVTGLANQSSLQVGVAVRGVGITAGTQIVSGNCGSTCTGTGLTGTYQVNNSQTVAGGSTAYFNALSGTNFISDNTGPKGGVHPSVLVELARVTGADIYYNLPVAVSDTAMTNIATYFKNNMPGNQRVFFQLGNENWNSSLGITYFWLNAAAIPVFGGSFNGLLYNGYRMAQLMTLVRNVYGTDAYNSVTNPASRWSGIVEGQYDFNNAASTAFMSGFTTWQSTCSCSLTVTNLFGEMITAGYWAAFPSTTDIQSITPGNPTTINSSGSNVTTGNVERIKVSVDGTVQLNNLNFVATRVDNDHFTIPINTTGSTYSGTMYFGSGPYYNMIDASAACFASSSASFTGVISGSTLTATGITGTIVLGQKVSYSGSPTNLYINSGSAGTYTLNQSSPTGSISMTSSACATKYQFFAQQNSKFIMTGTNDFGYTDANASILTGFAQTFAANAQFANSMGVQLTQYEGTNHIFPLGRIDPEMPTNYQWDAAGNDPTYTPAKVYASAFQTYRTYARSAYAAKYGDEIQAGIFSGLRYYGDTNPAWTATLAENALGPYVDPPAPVVYTPAYGGDASNRSVSNSNCDPCTETLPAAVIGTAATSVKIFATIRGGLITSVTCDGVTKTTPDVTQSLNSGQTAIYTIAVGAGSNTRSCSMTSGGGTAFQFRTFYVVTVGGLTTPNTPQNTGAQVSNIVRMNYSKNDLMLVGFACQGTYSGTLGVSPAGANPTTTTIFSSQDTVNNTSGIIAFRWPYSTTVVNGSAGFTIVPGCSQDGVVATYH